MPRPPRTPDVTRRPQADRADKFTLTAEPPPKKRRPVYSREEKARNDEWKLTKADKRTFAMMAHTIHQPTEAECWFRHTHWELKRARVRTALVAAGQSSRQVEVFDGCGAQCVVEYCEEEKRYRIRGDYCKCRHCEPCARAKANLLSANLRNRLEEKPDGRYRFVTLTLKHSDVPLVDQIRRLYKCFAQLRRRRFWRESTTGGVAIFECKWSPKTRLWHPHLHCVTEGGYMAQADLSDEWLAVTGDSAIVDIRALNSEKDAAHYVAKYVSKGTNGEVWHDAQASVEWVIAMKGVRTAATFGRWRGFQLLGHDADARHWKPVGMLDHLIAASRAGEPLARGIVTALVNDLQYNPHKPRGKGAIADAVNGT